MYTARGLIKLFIIVIFFNTTFFIDNGLSQKAYPKEPITMIVPWGPGAIDTLTRAICKGAEKELGQSIIVENKPGANSTIGVSYVKRSKPDGYTLGVAGSTVFTNTPHIMEVPFNVFTDFTDIASFARYNQNLFVRSDAQWNTFEDLILYAKNNPGKFTFAHSGIASNQRICLEQICMKEGIKLQGVPFKSGTEIVSTVLGGHTDGGISSSVECCSHVTAGKLKILLVLTHKRVFCAPNVPTVLEKGYSFTATTYISVFGPSGLPESIRQSLEGVFKRASEDPSFLETANQFQFEIVYWSGKETFEYRKSNYYEMREMFKVLGLTGK